MRILKTSDFTISRFYHLLTKKGRKIIKLKGIVRFDVTFLH